MLRTLFCMAAIALAVASGAALAEPKTGHVEANGLKVFYQEDGQGQPLLLLHGGSLTHKSWQWFAPEAAKQFRVIAMDSRGHGGTDNPGGAFSYDLMADDVAAVIEALKLEKPMVVGYSDGGIIALNLAVRHPGATKAVIVAGATHRVAADEHYFDGMEAYYLTRGKGSISAEELAAVESQRPQMAERYAQFHKDWKQLLTQIWPMWTMETVTPPEELAKIKVPLLVLLGDRDDFFTVEDAVMLHRAVTGSDLAILPGASHTVFRDRPELFNAVALDFLTRQTGR